MKALPLQESAKQRLAMYYFMNTVRAACASHIWLGSRACGRLLYNSCQRGCSHCA